MRKTDKKYEEIKIQRMFRRQRDRDREDMLSDQKTIWSKNELNALCNLAERPTEEVEMTQNFFLWFFGKII